MVLRPFAVASLLLVTSLLAGCAGDDLSESGPAPPREVHRGKDVVIAAGRLEVPAGGLFELEGGSLRLGTDDTVLVQGEIHVEGDFVVHNATIRGLLRLNVETTGRLLWESVVLEGGLAQPVLVLDSPDARIVGSELNILRMEVGAPAVVEDNLIRASTTLPAVTWSGADANFSRNELQTNGSGLLLVETTGIVADNRILVSGGPNTTGVGVRGGSVMVVGNTIEGAAVGVGLEDSTSTVADNVVQDSSSVGIAGQRGAPEIRDNMIRQAPIGVLALEGVGRVASNSVQEAHVGIAVLGGIAAVENNSIADAALGIGALGAEGELGGNLVDGSSAGVAVFGGNLTVWKNRMGACVANAGVNASGPYVDPALVSAASGTGVGLAGALGVVEANEVIGCDVGIGIQQSDLRVEGNVIGGAGGAGIAVSQGTIGLVGNSIEASAFGVLLDRADGSLQGNRVGNSTRAGIVQTSGNVLHRGNTLTANAGAGLFLQGVGAQTRLERNLFQDARNASAQGADVQTYWVGVVVFSGSPVLVRNTMRGNDAGLGIDLGTPSVRENNFETNRFFGAARRDPSITATIDVTNNWWGAATGPVVGSPDSPAPQPPLQRITPGFQWTPHSAQRWP